MYDHGGRGAPARPLRRRWRPRLAVLVAMPALVLAVAACSDGGNNTDGVASLSGANKPTTTTSAGPASKQDAQQAALEFARCMRQHGIDMPDPDPNGGGIVVKRSARNGRNAPEPEDDAKFKAAQQACQQYLPNAGKGPVLNSGGGK
jgi:hypothetical protein